MCFGVRDAIALALKESQGQPLSVLGDLVHNERVLTELRTRGVKIERETSDVRTTAVMITAHGASNRRIAEAKGRGLRVIEATCPLVHRAHEALRQLVVRGFHPVVIGLRGHVEVRGLTEDFAEVDIVLTAEEVERLQPRERFGVVAQTTQPVERVRELVRQLRKRFPEAELRFVDTVCRPTKERQHAAVELAQQSDVVIVIGGANSNNTRELVNTCRAYCVSVHHVQGPDDLIAEWFSSAQSVGLTAGTSTPDELIAEVEERLQEISLAAEPHLKIEARG
jgi:4-hydroxy-3-methylbut-2-enyl diphosphate reductase